MLFQRSLVLTFACATMFISTTALAATTKASIKSHSRGSHPSHSGDSGSAKTPFRVQSHSGPNANISQGSQSQPTAPDYDEADRSYDELVARLYKQLGLLRFNDGYPSWRSPRVATTDLVAEAAQDERRGDKFFAASKLIQAAQQPLFGENFAYGKKLVEHALSLSRDLSKIQRLSVSNELVQIGYEAAFDSDDRCLAQEYLLKTAIAERQAIKLREDADTVVILQRLSRIYIQLHRNVDETTTNKYMQEIQKGLDAAQRLEAEPMTKALQEAPSTDTDYQKAYELLSVRLDKERLPKRLNNLALLGKMSELLQLTCQRDAAGAELEALVDFTAKVLKNHQPIASITPDHPFDTLESAGWLTQLESTLDSNSQKIPHLERLWKAIYLLRIKVSGASDATTHTCTGLGRYLISKGNTVEATVLAKNLLETIGGAHGCDNDRSELIGVINSAELSHGQPVSTIDIRTGKIDWANERPPSAAQKKPMAGRAELVEVLPKTAEEKMDESLEALGNDSWLNVQGQEKTAVRAKLAKIVPLYLEAPGGKQASQNFWLLAEVLLNNPTPDDLSLLQRLVVTGYRKAARNQAPQWLSQATNRMTNSLSATNSPGTASHFLDSCAEAIKGSGSVDKTIQLDLLSQVALLQATESKPAEELDTNRLQQTLAAKEYGATSVEVRNLLLRRCKLQIQLKNLEAANAALQQAIKIENGLPYDIKRQPYGYSIGAAVFELVSALCNSSQPAQVDEAEQLVRQSWQLNICHFQYDEGYVRNAAYTVAQYLPRSPVDREIELWKWVIENQIKLHGDKHFQTSEYQIKLAQVCASRSYTAQQLNDTKLARSLYTQSAESFDAALATIARTEGPDGPAMADAKNNRAADIKRLWGR